jgi:hypothetical protein
MESPTPLKVREELSAIIKDIDSLMETMKAKGKMAFSEYVPRRGTIDCEIIRMETKIHELLAIDTMRRLRTEGICKENKQYKKALRIMYKILDDAVVKPHEIEHKYQDQDPIYWEDDFQKENFRKALIKNLERISIRLKEVQECL